MGSEMCIRDSVRTYVRTYVRTNVRACVRACMRACVRACVRCLLYTSDAADDLTRVDLGGRRIIKKKSGVLGELRGLERHWQIARKKLLLVVHSFLGRVPWRRG